MKKLIFRFTTIIKCLKQNTLLSGVVLISIATGLFYSCCLIGSFNYNLSSMQLNNKMENQSFVLAEMQNLFLNEDTVISTLKNGVEDEMSIVLSATLIGVPAFLKKRIFLHLYKVLIKLH